MIELYCTLIINKRRTIDQIPEKFRQEVIEHLKKQGYDSNGDYTIVPEA